LFQYAAGRSLAEKNKTSVVLDINSDHQPFAAEKILLSGILNWEI
jgi:hypothetical protein